MVIQQNRKDLKDKAASISYMREEQVPSPSWTGRYFAMFVNHSEMKTKADLATERDIGVTSEGEKITSSLGSVIHDHIGSNRPFPEDIVGCIIFRISRAVPFKGASATWFVDNGFSVYWSGRLDDIPDYVTSQISGDHEHFVAQPTASGLGSPYYSFTSCEEVGEVLIPSLGKTVGELSEKDLPDLFIEVDIDTFHVEDGDGEQMPWVDTFHCISCSEIIHDDDDSNGYCGKCYCPEPAHPAPEDVNYADLYEEWGGERKRQL